MEIPSCRAPRITQICHLVLCASVGSMPSPLAIGQLRRYRTAYGSLPASRAHISKCDNSVFVRVAVALWNYCEWDDDGVLEAGCNCVERDTP